MVRAVRRHRGLSAAAAGVVICASGMGLAWATGCALFVPTTTIEDLRFEGIDHVAVEEIEDEQSGSRHLQIVGPGNLQRVRLSTQESLSSVIRRRKFDYARSEVFFCGESAEEREIFKHDPWVYAGAERLQPVLNGENAADLPREDGRYVYSILFDRPAPIYRDYVSGQRPPLGTVDIEMPTKPVCLQIYVLEYWVGRVVKTNIVTLQSASSAPVE